MTPAEVLLPDAEPILVQVTFGGAFQPIDGRFHWYGRIAATERLPAELSGATVVLRTAYGEAVGRLSDTDPWGRHRISGTGAPPYELDESLEL